jgi:hypothetical protein
MLYISHRGNLEGLNPEKENNPEYIDEAIFKGYDVEIDLRVQDGNLFLGHDEPQYLITSSWLTERRNNLWIHVKDYGALVRIVRTELKFFCHEQDKYTLTSNGYIWSHDLTNKMTDKCIVPLLSSESVEGYNQNGFYAVCSDYIYECEEKFNV